MNDAREEKFDLTTKGLPQVVIKVRKQWDGGIRRFKTAQLQPLPGKVEDERIRPWIRQHPSYLPLKHCGLAEPLLSRQARQFVVRTRTPKKERQTGGEFEIADAVGVIRSHIRGLAFDAVNEFRMGKDTLQGHLD